MTQAGPLTLTPSSSLAPASGWLAQIGTFVLLAGVGLLVLPPLLYLAAAALKAGELGAVTIGSLLSLAAMTLSLATLATIWAMLLALPLAWLVVRTDLPFRNLCRWLAVIPLAIPSYIGAMSYIALLGPVGSVNTWLSSLIGAPQQWVNIYGFWGGVFVLGLFTYPYIFLLVSPALGRHDQRSGAARAAPPARRVALARGPAGGRGPGPVGVHPAGSAAGADRLRGPLPRSRPRPRRLHQEHPIDGWPRRHARSDPRTPYRVHRPAYAAPYRRAALRDHPDRLRDPGHRPRLEPDPPVQHLRPVVVRHGRGPRRGLSDPLPDPVGPGRGRSARGHQPALRRSGPLARCLAMARSAAYPCAPGAPHAVRSLGARVHLRHEGAGRHAAAAAGRVRHPAGAGLHPHRGGRVRAGGG